MQVAQQRECMAIALRRLSALESDAQALKRQLAFLGLPLLAPPHINGVQGPTLEAGRPATPTQARGVLSMRSSGVRLATNTVAIDMVGLVLEEAICACN